MQQRPAIDILVTEAIKAELAARNWSQRDLCRATGFTPSAIARRLTGEYGLSLADLDRIATAFDTTVAALCTTPAEKTCEPVA
jgi:transcriptional regulator with XRE-family HTH domain